MDRIQNIESTGRNYLDRANAAAGTVRTAASGAVTSALQSGPIGSFSNTAGRLGAAMDNINESINRENFKRPGHVPFYEFKSTLEAVVWLFLIVCGAATALLFLGYHNPDIYKNFSIDRLTSNDFLEQIIRRSNDTNNLEQEIKGWIDEIYSGLVNYYYLSNSMTVTNKMNEEKKKYLIGAVLLIGITWFFLVLCLVNRTKSGVANFLKGYHKNQASYWGIMLLGFAALAGFCIDKCVKESNELSSQYYEKTGSIKQFLPPGSHGGIVEASYRSGTSVGVCITNVNTTTRSDGTCPNGLWTGGTGSRGGTGFVVPYIGLGFGFKGSQNQAFNPLVYARNWSDLSTIRGVSTMWGPSGFGLGSGAKFTVSGITGVDGRFGICGVCITNSGHGYVKGSSVYLFPKPQATIMQFLPKAKVVSIYNTSGTCYSATGTSASGSLGFVDNLFTTGKNEHQQGRDGKWQIISLTGASVGGQTGAFGVDLTDSGRNYHVGDVLSLDYPAASRPSDHKPATIYVTKVVNNDKYAIPVAWAFLAGLFGFMTAFSWGRARDKSWIWKMIHEGDSQDSFDKEEAEYDATIKQWGKDGGASLNYGFVARYAKHMGRFKKIMKEQQDTLENNQKNILDALGKHNTKKATAATAATAVTTARTNLTSAHRMPNAAGPQRVARNTAIAAARTNLTAAQAAVGAAATEQDKTYRRLSGLINNYNIKDSNLLTNRDKFKDMNLLNIANRPSTQTNFTGRWVYLKSSSDIEGPVFVEGTAASGNLNVTLPNGDPKDVNKSEVSLVIDKDQLKVSEGKNEWVGGGPKLKKQN